MLCTTHILHISFFPIRSISNHLYTCVTQHFCKNMIPFAGIVPNGHMAFIRHIRVDVASTLMPHCIKWYSPTSPTFIHRHVPTSCFIDVNATLYERHVPAGFFFFFLFFFWQEETLEWWRIQYWIYFYHLFSIIKPFTTRTDQLCVHIFRRNPSCSFVCSLFPTAIFYIFILPTAAGVKWCVAAVKRLPVLHDTADYIFISPGTTRPFLFL